ncbi:hypothetical protein AX17_004315 [Amanita inopinata Kibby_2008]|nr:hypothetical protein AX17_004315 [Amanita inopinata Kibby_2008]
MSWPPVSAANVSWFYPTWQVLLSSSYPWKSILLDLASETLFRDLATCKSKMPILESLTLRVSEVTAYDAFEVAPQLTQVNLVCRGELRWHNKVSLPWSSLTKLTLQMDAIVGHGLVLMLQRLENIQELRFLFHHEPDYIDAKVAVPKRFDQLRILEVLCPEILEFIDAPRLSELHLSTYDFDDYSKALKSFLERSFCRIRRLTLERFDDECAWTVYKMLSEVEELCIIDEELPSSACLGHMTEDTVILPNLRALACTFSCIALDNEETKVGLISNIVEFRNKRRDEESPNTTTMKRLENAHPHLSIVFGDPIPEILLAAKPRWARFVDIDFKY